MTHTNTASFLVHHFVGIGTLPRILYYLHVVLAYRESSKTRNFFFLHSQKHHDGLMDTRLTHDRSLPSLIIN